MTKEYNLVTRIEKIILIEIANFSDGIEEFKKIDWQTEVYIDSSQVDYIDHEMEVFFSIGDREYVFGCDYESRRGWISRKNNNGSSEILKDWGYEKEEELENLKYNEEDYKPFLFASFKYRERGGRNSLTDEELMNMVSLNKEQLEKFKKMYEEMKRGK